MKIGELSKKTGLSVDAIRFYEKSGLTNGPSRTEGGYRVFSNAAVAAVEFISHCRSLDIPIPEIKSLIPKIARSFGALIRYGKEKGCLIDILKHHDNSSAHHRSGNGDELEIYFFYCFLIDLVDMKPTK